MSTNSNQMDDLMQQSHAKQTKLEKFLRTLDDHTMKQINMYLQENEPNREDTAPKLDKIKLYEDLLIVQVFKANEKTIGNKKKIEELCQLLKNQIQFSASTIRERIQKKLANVSKEEILDHIRLNINFTFNTKRKLMPVRTANPNSTSNIKTGEQSDDIYDSSQLPLNDGQRQSQSKQSKQPKQSQTVQQKSSKQSKVISINSSIESERHAQGPSESGNSVQQIPQHQPSSKSKLQSMINYSHNNVKSLKKCVPRDEVLKCRNSSNSNNNNNDSNNNNNNNSANVLQQQYNQFRVGSDHDSDHDIILVPESNNQYRVSTREVEKQLQWIINNVKQEYIKMKDHPQQPPSQNPQHNTATKNEVKQCQADKPNGQSKVQHQLHIINHHSQQPNPTQQISEPRIVHKKESIVPPAQQLHQFCSLEEWEAAHENPAAHQHLRWYSDEDEFLKSMISNGNVEQAISALQVVKKFKSASNVIKRLKYLNMQIPTYILTDLNASS